MNLIRLIFIIGMGSQLLALQSVIALLRGEPIPVLDHLMPLWLALVAPGPVISLVIFTIVVFAAEMRVVLKADKVTEEQV
ncbi:hypothetical protein ACYPKM_02815 [Pseudomonas aeruginosa]